MMRPRDRRWLVPIGFALALTNVAAVAVELRSIDVIRDGNLYKIRYVARIDVSPAVARRYLLDLENLSQLSDRVRESRILGHTPDGRTRVKLAFENCVLIFCKTTHRIANLEILNNLVVMRTEPADSDFHFGHERWEAHGDAHHTVIEYAGAFIPKFWIPPLIDTWLIEQYAESEITKTGAKIEELGRVDADDLP